MLGQKYNGNYNSYVLGKKHSSNAYSLGNKYQPSNMKIKKPIESNSAVIENMRTDEKQREPKGFYKYKEYKNDVERKMKSKDFYN